MKKHTFLEHRKSAIKAIYGGGSWKDDSITLDLIAYTRWMDDAQLMLSEQNECNLECEKRNDYLFSEIQPRNTNGDAVCFYFTDYFLSNGISMQESHTAHAHKQGIIDVLPQLFKEIESYERFVEAVKTMDAGVGRMGNTGEMQDNLWRSERDTILATLDKELKEGIYIQCYPKMSYEASP